MKIRLQKDFIYKIMFLLLLLLPITIKSVEVNLAISLLFTGVMLMHVRNIYTKTLFNVLFFLVLILGVAFVSSWTYPKQLYDFVKDAFYLVKPIIFIFLGFVLIQNIADKTFLFKAFISISLIFAIKHLYIIFIGVGDLSSFSVNKIRAQFGKANYIELFGFIFVILNKKWKILDVKPKWRIIISLIIISSIVLYFSRTMAIALALLYISFNGYLKVSKKGLMYLTGLLMLIVALYAYLFSIEIKRDETGFSSMLYKIKIAPMEVFATKIDVNNRADLWDHWRSYEALKAYESLEKRGSHAFVIGGGLGSLVDLEFNAPLSQDDEGMRYISILHNAYAFLLYKSGIIGLLCYILTLFYLFLQTYHKMYSKNHQFVTNGISAIGLFYLFSSLIITGMFNPGDIVSIVLGGFIYLQYYYKHQEII